MTEAEVKSKWCPFARTSVYGRAVAANRYEGVDHPNQVLDNPITARCLGSACMAFRTGLIVTDEDPITGVKVQKETCYCGLAGKP